VTSLLDLLHLSSVEEVEEHQQDDGTSKRYPHDCNRERLMDRSEMEYGAQEATGKERKSESHDDMDYQIRAGHVGVRLRPNR
jgi:hypothetical protein